MRHLTSRGRVACLLPLFAALPFLTPIAAAEAADGSEPTPLQWGIDDAGGPGDLLRNPNTPEVFDRFGFAFWVHHYLPAADKLERGHSIAGNVRYLDELDAWGKKHGVRYILNLETDKFVGEWVDDQGRDWFNRPDGRHWFEFPDELMEKLSALDTVMGLQYDEPSYMQVNRGGEKFDKAYFWDGEGRDRATASDGFVAAAREIFDRNARYGLTSYGEFVFPLMFHDLARAGGVPVTKVLKETWSPVYVATALGAAIQYDKPLWISPDLWFRGTYPGHSPEALRSALVYAHQMGAESIYVENLAYSKPAGRGSLVNFTADGYEVTPHGEQALAFIHDYVPANPRHHSFRELKPRVAIVRQEDSSMGTSYSYILDGLWGVKDWQAEDVNRQYLHVWHLLTRGVVGREALNWHSPSLAQTPYQLFAPVDGVVVFDERVEAEHLAGVEAIFLVGTGVSEETLAAIAAEVERGALCVTSPRLAPDDVRARASAGGGEVAAGSGRWLVTDDFLSDRVRRAAADLIPKEDRIRYRFGDTTVVFRPADGDMNSLSVEQKIDAR